MREFYKILANGLVAGTTNSFVWFALTFWAYLETQSVLATSVISGVYMVANTISSFWFGSIVDHNKKKTAMILSSAFSLTLFAAGFILYNLVPKTDLASLSNPAFWVLALILLCGTIAGNIRYIAIPTIVAILVPEGERDKANGMTGTVTGIAFSITSVASGFVLANWGMFWVLALAIIFSALALVHMFFVDVPEKEIIHVEGGQHGKIDLKGTMAAINAVPGLFALIIFTTFNNLLGGVFMALMDAYGLSLVSLQTWGTLWGILSLGFIVGGIFIAKRGLGNNPLRLMFLINIVLWTVAALFTVQASITLLAVGMFIWISLMPFIEATEQTIFQKVVPLERLGRVLGIAHSIESAASPITAFLIGPLAQFVFIPFMTTGRGVDLIGGWFGVGQARGIALVFTVAGILGLIITLIAMQTRSYKVLADRVKS